MSDTTSEIYRYFEQRQELFPGDFYQKPPQPQHQPQLETQPQHQSQPRTLITSGKKGATIIFVCTRPLSHDVQSNTLISGEAGALFDKIIKAIDLTREDVYITPLRYVDDSGKIFSNSNKTIIDKLIDGNKPKIIISLGDNAGNELLDEKHKLDSVHGKVFHYRNVPLVFTYHPEMVRRNKQLKRPVWEDFKIIRDVITK